MRFLLFLLLSLIAVASAQADPAGGGHLPAFDSKRTYTLLSVSQPGLVVTEQQGLASVADPSVSPPLRFRIVVGLLGGRGCVSLASASKKGYYLRHNYSRLKLHPLPEDDDIYVMDATFYLEQNEDGSVSFRSVNYPNKYITVIDSGELYIVADPELRSRSFKLGD